MAQPVFNQVTHRIHDDDGSESGATWLTNQGDDYTAPVDTIFRPRFLIDEQNSKAWSSNFIVYYDLNGGGYTAITDITPIQWVTSSQITNNTNTTSLLTGGVGTFLTTNSGVQSGANSVSNSGAINQYFEIEIALRIDSAQVANNDTISLRVYLNTGALDVYTDTLVLTVSEVGGNTFTQTNTGAMNSSGALAKITKKALSGISSFVGDILKKTITSLSGISTFSGDLSKKIFEFLDGNFSSSGTLLKNIKKLLGGSSSFSGDILRKISKALSGTSTFSGDTAKKSYKFLDGVFSSSGVLNAIKQGVKYFQSVSGSFDSSGDIYKITKKTLLGNSPFSGDLAKKMFESFSGTMASSGVLNAFKLGKKYFQSLFGEMNSSGEIFTKFKKILSGVSTFVGDVSKKTSRRIFGSETSSGTVSFRRRLTAFLSGTFSSSGDIVKKTNKILSGISSFSGDIRKKTRKTLSGASTFIGNLLASIVRNIVHGKGKFTIESLYSASLVIGEGKFEMTKQFFDIGDAVRVKIEFKDEDGVLGDPTNVSFSYKVTRSGTPVTYSYGTDAELVRVSVGVYYVDVKPSTSDPHYVKFVGEGGLDATAESVFYVRNSYFE